MRTWGDSWGDCWGDTWGSDDTVDTAVAASSGGPDPRRHTDFTDDQLIELAVQLIISGVLDG